MKLFSPKGRPLSRTAARNAALLNLLATPGLGSLIVRRWIAGGGQLLLAVVGFTLIILWFVKQMSQYYGQITGEVAVQPVGNFFSAGAILFVGSWIWSAFTSLGLMREAAAGSERAMRNSAAPPVQKMAEGQIPAALASVPNWSINGTMISRTFQFKDFPAAIRFVQTVAIIAEEAWHHPDIDIRWNKVTLKLTTHDASGLTEKDFSLAQQFDKL